MRKVPSDMVAGTLHMSKKCGELEVIEYVRHGNVAIRFLNTGHEIKAAANNIRKGEVKDKLAPSVFGVGFIGLGRFKPSIKGRVIREYATWQNMIQRCYDQKYQERFPTYVGCSVCQEWHNFQVFAEWMTTQDHEGKQLDKDIKSEGNKVYSPETCTFVTNSENTIKAMAKLYRFKSPQGDSVDIYNLNEFCRENGLDVSAMSKVHLGKWNQHKKWTKQ